MRTRLVAGDAVGPGERVGVEVRIGERDHDLVVWRTSDGRPCVMDARCPHQWSHLAAEGVVDGDEIVCTSHFWRFRPDGEGAKVAMSGRRDVKAPIDVYPCDETDGTIHADLPL